MRSFNTVARTVTLSLLVPVLYFSLPAQTVYSTGSGVWNAPGLWNTQPDGSGTPVAAPDDPSLSVVIQNSHHLTLPGSADFSVFNLTVENGGVLQAGSSSNRYIQVFGTQVLIDGVLGGDGLSLDIDGPDCTISGTGTLALSRLKKDLDPGASNHTNLAIDTDLSLSWSSSAALLNQASPSNSVRRTFNVTINPGVTVTVAGDVSIDGVNGATNNAWNEGVFTIYGMLDISGNLYVNTANPSGGNISYIIGNGGRVTARNQVIGNSGSGGSAMAILTVQSGGTLEITGPGDAFSAFGGGREMVTFNSGALADYAGPDQNIAAGFSYAGLNTSGGNKFLTGATLVDGALSLFSGRLITGDHDLTIGTNGSIAGGTATSYILTSGEGRLRRRVGTTPVYFPIGTFTGFNPVTLSNAGTADVFSVRVTDGVFDNGTSGNLLTGAVVDKTWILDEDQPGGSNLTLTVQWNGFDELPGFDRFGCYLSHYDSGWSQDDTGQAAGSDPYTRTRTGIQGLSPFAAGSLGALSVSLIRFTGRRTGQWVVLDWETESEKDNRFFTVERSSGPAGFEAIGRIPGAGNSDRPLSYQWIDRAPPAGIAFYRLGQTDADGVTGYCDVIAVAPLSDQEPDRTLAQPIVSDRLTIVFGKSPIQPCEITIVDRNGRQAGTALVGPGSRTAEIPVPQLPPGLYFLVWADHGQPHHLRFVKI